MPNIRILIVEDDDLNVSYIEGALKPSGYEITAAVASGELAVQAAAANPPDIVLMDIRLKGKIDGIEAASQIRANHDIPILYLTAHADGDLLDRVKATEPFGYLLKPFREQELRIAIAMALYRHKLENDLREANRRFEQEITERKRMEEALRKNERQYRTLAENVADGVAILQEGKLVFVNQSLADLLGYSKDRLLRLDFIDVLREDYKELGRQKIILAEQGLTESVWQVPYVVNDGREIWTETHYSFVEWDGKTAILVTIKDITAHKVHALVMERDRERLWQENLTLRTTIKERYRFGEIIGKSPAMQTIYELIVQAAVADEHVLIYGESGTGKELIARTIHQMSARRDKDFVAVNCGAIPDPLFESEFFGHRKGAFTGAYADQSGFFDTAHQGTLFLDEISELSPAMQVKLLRALEGSGYTPVGDHTIRIPNVRIIAATNRNPVVQLQNGTMREDFFYRIHVIAITVPPLRERKEDIPLLLDHFLEQYRKSNTSPILPGEILEELYRYDWPGNVRELQNVLRQYLTIHRLDFPSLRSVEPVEIRALPGAAFATKTDKLHAAMEEFEKQLITKGLHQHNWHRAETAVALGIPTRTLHRKMKKYRLIQPYPKP